MKTATKTTLNIIEKAKNNGWDTLTLKDKQQLIMSDTTLPEKARKNACKRLEGNCSSA